MLPWPRWCAQTPPGWRACWAASQPPQLTWPMHPRRCLLARRAQEPWQLCCVVSVFRSWVSGSGGSNLSPVWGCEALCFVLVLAACFSRNTDAYMNSKCCCRAICRPAGLQTSTRVSCTGAPDLVVCLHIRQGPDSLDTRPPSTPGAAHSMGGRRAAGGFLARWLLSPISLPVSCLAG